MRFVAKVLVKAGPFFIFPSFKRDPGLKGHLHYGQLGHNMLNHYKMSYSLNS